MVHKITDAEFTQLLEDNDKVVVKYFANWCGNCRLFAPKFNRMSDKDDYKDIKFLDINAEENPTARKLGGVNNLPFFAVFKGGKLLAADSTSKEELVEKLIQQLA